MRLIDVDALKYDIGEIDDGQYKRTELYVTNEAIAKQPTIDAVPLDGSFLKMSKGDYLIYNRHWLYEHFDMEMEIQRSAMKSMGYEPAIKDAEEDFPEGFFEKPRRHATEKKDPFEEQLTVDTVPMSAVRKAAKKLAYIHQQIDLYGDRPDLHEEEYWLEYLMDEEWEDADIGWE